MTTASILLVLAIAFTFAIMLNLLLASTPQRWLGEQHDPGASTTRGILFDRHGVPRRYY